MHFTGSSTGLLAGVVISLAYFALVGHLVKALRTTHRLPTVIVAVSGLVGALPAILYALYRALDVVA
ncbi:hypothetical protein [Streptomyces sp. SID14515]|uniref:hypothetical protein n=1 Tax=Streptomyces sp. SID14515 TaxID=2706074 RepID=UPI0013CD117B|nr:hypothetical protein [Streptomyces sp. SID14515]NEB37280.1 hypothetical protein [Streptomyces sp. SID14515]